MQNLLKEVSGFPFDAVGISTQMHGIVYVNAKGEAATPLYTWKEECGNLPFRGRESYAEYLSRMTGYPMYTGYGSVTHFYLWETGKIPADAQGFVACSSQRGPLFAGTCAQGFPHLAAVWFPAKRKAAHRTASPRRKAWGSRPEGLL